MDLVSQLGYTYEGLLLKRDVIAEDFRPLQMDFLFPVHRPHGLFVKPENSIISVTNVF